MTGRRRSSSIAGPAEVPQTLKSTTLALEALEATQKLWELVCYAMEDPLSKQTLLHSSSNICLIKALLDRAHQLDYYSRTFVPPKGGKSPQSLQSSHWLSTMLRVRDGESGYTPLHRAVLKADLPKLLLLLRYTTMSLQSNEPSIATNGRMMHRPLELLQGDVVVSSIGDDARAVFQAVDQEGMTPFQLLERLQVKELEQCRKSLQWATTTTAATAAARRPRQNSFELQQDHHARREQNEFAELHDYMRQQQQQQQQSVFHNNHQGTTPNYACEVLAFGRANHLALGVQGGNKNHVAESTTSDASAATTYRPHRVQTFAQDRVGRGGSAVAVAAAAHHTLVATRDGQLFAFGVGTGGRLGTGDNEKHCPAPTRVLGPLTNRRVVAIAAAENHSLCVTSDGAVFAFGSNRFGQLGYSSTGSGDTNDSGSSSKCCLPRRVEDLWKKHILCTSVAAGEKHSVALSQKGEVYVWGCNASGQLGIHRRSTSNSAMAHKVQRVDALWSEEKKRICFQVAASSQATLVLAKPSQGGLPVNQVYAWGHGNHVPSRVHFVDSNESNSRREGREHDVFMSAGNGRRSINPVEIACARHHSAAITSDGRVYTWGFHADPLGGGASKQGTPKSSKNNCSQPQLVTGMLPEEGGGFAVAVSASENHTAVVTNEGSLFTWGASNGKGLLGHEGVRWQPNPKRVSGVSRAVGVSAAKEHTVLLMGTSFPGREENPHPDAVMSLERLASQEVIKHVDLFNVLPILMTAERTNCRYVIEYCQDFIRLNLDGILNVGQKSNMDMYLKEQVASGLLLLDEEARDRRERPIVLDVALAAQRRRPGFHESETILSDPIDWIQSCERLFKKDSLTALLNRMRKDSIARQTVSSNPRYLRWRSSSSLGSFAEAYSKSGPRNRSSSHASASETEKDVKMSSSERCIMLTTNMDLSTRELVQAKYDCLTKEIRALKKRLGQISKLEEMQIDDDPDKPPITLSADQMEKVARRPQLESELCIFEPALERVQRCMLHFNLRLKRFNSIGNEEEKCKSEAKDDVHNIKEPETKEENPDPDPAVDDESKPPVPLLRCAVCKITCPDEKSYALHMNGRKHRNRVAQEAEEEKKKAAALMMEECNRQKMEEMMKPLEVREKPKTSSPWSKPSEIVNSATPKYKLPPPESATQELVVVASEKPKSLQEIMAEEAKRSINMATSKKKPAKASFTPKQLQLPPGSAPAMKSPPWASKPVVASLMTSPAPPVSPAVRKSSPASKSNQLSPWQTTAASPAKMNPAVHFPESTAPPLRSPLWAATPTKAATPTLAPSPPLVSTPKSASSFGDFLRKPPSTPQQVKASATPAPWSASAAPKNVPGATLTNKPKASPSTGVRFHEIQKEEAEFRDNLRDQSYQDNSSWFIDRRERAGSFATIQEEANREREEQLFIEEQKRIEEQILREVALQKKKEEKKKRQQAKKKAKQNENQAKTEEDSNSNIQKNQHKNKKEKTGSKHKNAKEENAEVGGSDVSPQEISKSPRRPQKGGGNSKRNNNRRKANRQNPEKPSADAEAAAPGPANA